MRFPRLVLESAVLAAFIVGGTPASANAQGVTTGAIGGRVTDEQGGGVAGVQVTARNNANVFASSVTSRADGRYLVPNLEVGMYEVSFRRLGFEPKVRRNQPVSLSQVLPLDVQITVRATELTGVTIIAATTAETFTPTNTSIKTIVTDTAIQRMPSLNRNVIDLVRNSPQVSSTGAGYSAGGMSNRMNNVQIDGATERDVFGLGATGQPGAEVNSRSVSLEAVKELQILLAPFDVRQGNFGGLLVNAVTKGGSNELHGSVYGYYRDQDYGRNVPQLRATPFDRTQYGFSLGGPIIKDKLHFFVAPEWQTENTPVSGTYLGQPASLTPGFPIQQADLTRFGAIDVRQGDARRGNTRVRQHPQSAPQSRPPDFRINDTTARWSATTTVRASGSGSRTAGAPPAVYPAISTPSTRGRSRRSSSCSRSSRGTSNEFFLGYNC